MVAINVAYTAPINPSSSSSSSSDSSPLTLSQCWQGLQLKVRNAPLFVGAISVCDVLEDSKDERFGTVTREVVFRGDEQGKRVKEVCKSFWPMKVDFHQTDGSVITNTISDGPSGSPTDLHMTYSFQLLHPELDCSVESEEYEQMLKKHKALAKMAVDKSIESIRRLVDEGKIK